jgi:hypothetical protein
MDMRRLPSLTRLGRVRLESQTYEVLPTGSTRLLRLRTPEKRTRIVESLQQGSAIRGGFFTPYWAYASKVLNLVVTNSWQIGVNGIGIATGGW